MFIVCVCVCVYVQSSSSSSSSNSKLSWKDELIIGGVVGGCCEKEKVITGCVLVY